MKTLILIAALISTPALAAKPQNIVPASLSWSEVKAQIGNLTVRGCSLEQGAEITFLRTHGKTYATSRTAFDSLMRDTRDLDTTLIALDAGHMLCEAK